MVYHLLAFDNTHTAIAAQNRLKAVLDFQIMPTLRELTESCGISLLFLNGSSEAIKKAIASSDMDKTMAHLYYIDDSVSPIHILPLDW